MSIELTEDIVEQIKAYDKVKLEREAVEADRANLIIQRDSINRKIAEADEILSKPLADNAALVEVTYKCICEQLK